MTDQPPDDRRDPERAIREVLSTPSIAIQVRSYRWSAPVDDNLLLSDRCFLDLSLTPRPGQPRGRYVERWRASEPIGDVLFLAPSLEFRGSHGAGRQVSLSILLAPELFDLRIDALDDAHLAEGMHMRDPGVRAALWRLAAEVRLGRIESPALLEAAVISIAEAVERRLAQITAPGGFKRGGLPPARMRLIEERIRVDLPPPRINELAQLCGLSERQLARTFRQETGESLGSRIAASTLQRAWGLLTQSDTPIRRVAKRLGFSSSASFAAAFRNSTGCRPSDVRRCDEDFANAA
jgi:AraC family transcriptional regulator